MAGKRRHGAVSVMLDDNYDPEAPSGEAGEATTGESTGVDTADSHDQPPGPGAAAGAEAPKAERSGKKAGGGSKGGAKPPSGQTAKAKGGIAAEREALGSVQDEDLPARHIPTERCRLWEWADRPEEEYHPEDLEELAKSLYNNGQAQPGTVRILPEGEDFDYEVITGARRFRAAQMMGLPFLAVVRDLSERQAWMVMEAENSHREDLSPYTNAIKYQAAIDRGDFTRSQLQLHVTNYNKTQFYKVLRLAQIPEDMIQALGGRRNLTIRGGLVLVDLIEKGPEYRRAVGAILPRVRAGEVALASIGPMVEKRVQGEAEETSETSTPGSHRVTDAKGRHLFSWRTGNEGFLEGLTFPKDVQRAMAGSGNQSELEERLKTAMAQVIENQDGSEGPA